MQGTIPRVRFRGAQTTVALLVGTFEPCERTVYVSSHPVRLRDLNRHGFCVLLDELLKQLLRILPVSHGMLDDRRRPALLLTRLNRQFRTSRAA